MEKTTRPLPKLGWAYKHAMARTRSLVSLFLFLFLLVMPIALLIIGKDNYLANTAPNPFSSADYGPHLNEVLLPLHAILGLLSAVYVYFLGGTHFNYLYRRNVIDREESLPFSRDTQFWGRTLAHFSELFIVFFVNALLTGVILSYWGFGHDFAAYLPLYLSLFLSTLELTGFSLVLFSLSGTLFDAILLNLAIQGTWIVSVLQILDLTERLHDTPSDLIWFLAPASRFFSAIVWPHSVLQTVAMIVFWTVSAWLCFRKRPAEYAAVRNGQLSWYPWLQPLFSMFSGLSLGQFIFLLFDPNVAYLSPLRSPAFYIGYFIGLVLGQWLSSAVMGKPIRKEFFRKELPLSLLGIVFFIVIAGLARLFIPRAY
ncbi:MAG: hypothetical protein M0P44_03910 [Clostridiales bacterium]|jgi:hypothetical protein|nr:hypothetical protein [Clostridiales bacterium]MDD3540896.1 hypothetical protein [Eubacteriales bacterium]MDY0119353.1 hypothetical protein [Clostridia bacterium]